MMSHRILPAVLLLCTLAACGDLPTHSDIQAQPAGPAYDDGYTMGSGNRAVLAGGSGVGSGDAAAEGGGFTIGSGNIDGDDNGFGVGSGNIVAGVGYGSGHRGAANDPLLSTSTMSEDSTGRSGYTMGSGN
jgi:hypothetical protein